MSSQLATPVRKENKQSTGTQGEIWGDAAASRRIPQTRTAALTANDQKSKKNNEA